jgi:hypothetical protein
MTIPTGSDTRMQLPSRQALAVRVLFGIYEPALTVGGAIYAMISPAAFLGALVADRSPAEIRAPVVELLVRSWAVTFLVIAGMELACVWRGGRPVLRGALLALLVGDLVHTFVWRQSFTGSASCTFATVMNIGNTLLFAAARVWTIGRLRARRGDAPLAAAAARPAAG